MQCGVLDKTHLKENLPFLEWKELVDFALSILMENQVIKKLKNFIDWSNWMIYSFRQIVKTDCRRTESKILHGGKDEGAGRYTSKIIYALWVRGQFSGNIVCRNVERSNDFYNLREQSQKHVKGRDRWEIALYFKNILGHTYFMKHFQRPL